VSPAADGERTLGVVECFAAVARQCPKGPARAIAEHALATLERDGAAALREQAFLVLGAIQGWQGERAAQVRRSLRIFLGPE
jgi:hypothetical protein